MTRHHSNQNRDAQRKAKLTAVLIVSLPLVSLAAGAAAALLRFGAI